MIHARRVPLLHDLVLLHELEIVTATWDVDKPWLNVMADGVMLYDGDDLRALQPLLTFTNKGSVIGGLTHYIGIAEEGVLTFHFKFNRLRSESKTVCIPGVTEDEWIPGMRTDGIDTESMSLAEWLTEREAMEQLRAERDTLRAALEEAPESRYPGQDCSPAHWVEACRYQKWYFGPRKAALK